MAQLTTSSRLLPPLAAVLLLAGCADSSLSRTFGLVRDTPDEFTVVTRAPLSMPPDYTLRPPMPGAPRPQDLAERTQAEAALVPEAALGGGNRAGQTPGQSALVRAAGGAAPADIRQRVDQEARTGTNDDGFVDRLLYWRKSDPSRAVVNPTAEAQRLRQNSALGQSPVTGETPVIRSRKSGWFSDLFSWL